ncbi:MAG: aminotransferase class I/II-fold pyridoxal phosphate-dependent enzyme [Firmicutes bacterium]|nr:aminotransferase class I/II-fold pyridoxal phosphate-dependent enzyme [Bacillota bacterium]
MNEDLRKNIRQIAPYTAGERPDRPGIVKLNTNENPYPPSPGVIEAFRSLAPEDFRLYPDAESTDFRRAAAKFYGLAENQVFPANGSDDALALIFLTFFNSGKPVLFPDVTYSFYPVWSRFFGVPFETAPLDADFRINPSDYSRENGGVVLANPNAPTGVALGPDEIRYILDKNPGVIVALDEAYIDFGGISAVPLLREYDNLIIVHTFSKYRSLAGMRLACALGSAELIACLGAAKNSYNSYPISRAGQCIAAAAFADDAYYRACAARIALTREKFVGDMAKLGFRTLPSAANFVFTAHEKMKAKEIFLYLKEKDIYVRHWDLPRIGNHLRITVGTEEQMEKVVTTIKEFPEVNKNHHRKIGAKTHE